MNDRSYLQLIRDRGFGWMLVTQFLGALNDNVYRFMVVFYIGEHTAKQDDFTLYNSLVAALFVVPYLIFSGYAGQLADKFTKRSVLIATKSVEVVAMVLALVAFMLGSIPLMLVIIFLMATHSAFFSPAKYSSLPELLPVQDLSRGNALIEMSTFLAIIIGTALGGYLFHLAAINRRCWGRSSSRSQWSAPWPVSGSGARRCPSAATNFAGIRSATASARFWR